jgi:hypothetical protein
MSEIHELNCGAGGDSPPVGQYDPIEFVGLEQVPAKGEMGEGIRWRFKVLEGEHAGKIVGRIGPMRPTPKNASGKILAGMLGRAIGDEKVNIKDLIGKRFVGVVALSDNDKPRLELVWPKK